MTEKLPHTRRTDELLAAGERSKAIAEHNAIVDAAFSNAKAGATINLTDLMAASEQIHIHDIEKGA